jgi:hypothetical protein
MVSQQEGKELFAAQVAVITNEHGNPFHDMD